MQSRNTHYSGSPRGHGLGRQQRDARKEGRGRSATGGMIDYGAYPRRWTSHLGGPVCPSREETNVGGRSERGEPELGCEAVQGIGGPNRSEDLGERKARGPGRAKAARAGVSSTRNCWPECIDGCAGMRRLGGAASRRSNKGSFIVRSFVTTSFVFASPPVRSFLAWSALCILPTSPDFP